MASLLLLGKSEVLRYSTFNLHVHLVVHVTLGLASAQVNYNHIHQDQHNHDADDQAYAHSILLVLHGDFSIVDGLLHGLKRFFVQGLEALLGRSFKGSAEGVEDG